jgi:hypothetical protein
LGRGESSFGIESIEMQRIKALAVLVSHFFLQKTATLATMRGDFRPSGTGNIEFGTKRFFVERKMPANGGHLTNVLGEISKDHTGWLATQCRWSYALPSFLANREFYREFRKIAALGTPETATNGLRCKAFDANSLFKEQGIILIEQGNLARQQGIS